MHYSVSFLVFAIILSRKRELAALVLLPFGWMSCHCKCPVALPHGVVGWSAVCDCDISLTHRLVYYSLPKFRLLYLLKIFANSVGSISGSI